LYERPKTIFSTCSFESGSDEKGVRGAAEAFIVHIAQTKKTSLNKILITILLSGLNAENNFFLLFYTKKMSVCQCF